MPSLAVLSGLVAYAISVPCDASIAPSPRLKAPLKLRPRGMVPAGIEEQQLDAHAAVGHPRQHPLGRNGVVFDITGGVEPRASRHGIVYPVHLHTMAREEEQTRTPGWHAVRKAVDGLLHRGLIGIAVERDVKAQATQGRQGRWHR